MKEDLTLPFGQVGKGELDWLVELVHLLRNHVTIGWITLLRNEMENVN